MEKKDLEPCRINLRRDIRALFFDEDDDSAVIAAMTGNIDSRNSKTFLRS